MNLPRKRRSLPLLLLLALGVVQLACGAEEEVSGVTATASKYDTRSSADVDENKGCYTDGCSADLTLDELLNDVPESRWSCAESLEGTEAGCYITYDLGSLYSLTRMEIYFYKSDELDRDVNPFTISTSDDGVTFTDSFDGVNTAGTALGVAEEFEFPAGASGQYVRFTAILAEDQWMSMCEAIIYADVASSPAPAADIPEPTAAASSPVAVIVDPTVTPTAGITSSPSFGDPCSTVTVSKAGDYNGDYTSTTTTSTFDGTEVYSSSTISATIAASVSPAACPTSGSETDCSMNVWQITSQDVNSTLPTYLVYDAATHPSTISEVWLILEDCTSGACTSSPTDVEILCSDGSTAASATPAPSVTTASDCEIIEVAGTSGAASDGLYYNDGSAVSDGVAQYAGYDVAAGELTSNGLTVLARTVDSTCSTTSTSATACSWRQWWIESSSTGAVNYFTYDEADHPADVTSDTLWYTSDTTVEPYAGDVTVTCSSATIPPVGPTPAPSAADRDIDVTRAPVSPAPVGGNSTSAPAVTGADGEGSGESSSQSLGVIVGGAAAGAALLALIGVLVYKMKKPPPPPSYDDLVGGA